MDNITQAAVHKTEPRKLIVEQRPAWISFLDHNEDGLTFGLTLTRLDGPYACSPDNYVTEDGGFSFYSVSNCIQGEPDFGVNKVLGELETDPEKISALLDLFIEYQKTIGGPIFSL